VVVCGKAYVLDEDRIEPQQEDELDTIPPPPCKSLKPCVSDQPVSSSTSALLLPSPVDVTESVSSVLQSTPVAACVECTCTVYRSIGAKNWHDKLVYYMQCDYPEYANKRKHADAQAYRPLMCVNCCYVVAV